jgi:hypothetical protein
VRICHLRQITLQTKKYSEKLKTRIVVLKSSVADPGMCILDHRILLFYLGSRVEKFLDPGSGSASKKF